MNANTKLDLKLLNGTVLVTNSNQSIVEVSTDLGIKNGKITSIGSLKNTESIETFDAKGLHILPGIIDSQVHFREPGLTHKEDIETGTKAAVLGGITAVFEMPNTKPSTTTLDLLNEKINIAKNKSYCDIGFYIGGSSDNIDQLADLENQTGCCGIKIFMGSSTGTLLVDDDVILEKILKSGHKRIAVHCEDESRIKARSSIATDSKSVRYHHIWRDEETALIATQKLISLAKKNQRQVHVLHVTTSQEMEFLAANKNWATVEVLPQHLTLFAPECYERLGNFAQQNPPIRTSGHMAALWKALEKGIVDIIASDHAPHTIEEKKREYPNSPSGMPGVQTLVPIMLNHIHNEKLTLKHFVQLTAINPAKIFNLKNRGNIQLGSDATFTLVDLNAERRIENSWIASKCGWTPYDGMKVTGWVNATIIRGEFALRDEQLQDKRLGQILNFNE